MLGTCSHLGVKSAWTVSYQKRNLDTDLSASIPISEFEGTFSRPLTPLFLDSREARNFVQEEFLQERTAPTKVTEALSVIKPVQN